MALPLAPLALFTSVIFAAGAVTAGGIGFTADTVARMAAATRISAPATPKRSYVPRLPLAAASDLDIARSVPANPGAPTTMLSPVQPTRTAADSSQSDVPGVYVLDDGRWVELRNQVRGWTRADDGNWTYGDLAYSQPALD